MTEPPIYKNITATVRTPRCAILINENSKYWKTVATGAIRCASEVWGGRYFLLVPTDGTRIKDKFWEILEAYSPDHLATYNITVTDMADAEPAHYAEFKERYRKQFEKQRFSQNFEDWFLDNAEASEIDRLEISTELQQELVSRLSPFHFQGEAVREWLSRSSGFGFPFTKVSDIISGVTRHIGEIALPKAIEDPTAALLVHAQTGIASAEYCKALRAHYFAVNPLPDNYDTGEFICHVLGSQSPVLQTDSDHSTPADDYMPRTPFGLSMLHLGQYYRLDKHKTDEEPVVVIIGDTADDFCLYYSLSRLHERVCWLPLAWLQDCCTAIETDQGRRERGEEPKGLGAEQNITRSLVNLFFQLVGYGRRNRRIELRSMSLDGRQLMTCREQMAACSYATPEQFISTADCIPIEQTSTDCMLRVFEENNYTNNRSVVFAEGVTVSPFDTPKPKNFSTVIPSGHYWLTSLQIEGYAPPSLPSLGTQLVNIHDLPTESRVANDGIAYHCPNIGYFGGDIDVTLVRPKIKMLDEMALLGAYFADMGVTIQYSDKGNYFVDTLRRFGGLAETGQFIKAATTRSILEKFMSRDVAEDGSVVFLANDQRSYLNLEALTNSLGDEVQAADLADKLVGQRVLQRGHILHCERCRLSSWYGIDALTSDFTCNRCSYRQLFTRTHWKQPVEPHWYYRLAETVYQFYSHNSHLTVQVLCKLQSEARLAFHFAPEIELIDFPTPGEKKEMDIACIVDGQIILGECKTDALKPKDVAKFETLIGRAGKRPHRVVFATALTQVSPEFTARIGRLPGSELMTFGDLYDK